MRHIADQQWEERVPLHIRCCMLVPFPQKIQSEHTSFIFSLSEPPGVLLPLRVSLPHSPPGPFPPLSMFLRRVEEGKRSPPRGCVKQVPFVKLVF